MARGSNRPFLRAQLVRFRLAGYRVADPRTINLAHYGLGQERHRIFIVGIRSDFGLKYKFPEPTHGPSLLPLRTQREVLREHKEEWPHGEFYDKGFHWYYLSRNRYRGWNETSKTVLAHGRHMPLHPMSPPLRKVKEDQWAFVGDPEKARRLSFREAAVLQGLDGWKFPDTVGLMKKYQIIGNAVPPMIIQQIVKAMPSEIF